MTIAHWIVLLLFIAAFAAAVRYCLRHGICGGNDCESCKGGCGGNCAHCRGRCPAAKAAEMLASRRETPIAEDKP